MDADWIISPTGRRVLGHWGERRPVWLWSQDGSSLLWRNPVGRYFGAKIKKGALRLAPEAVPIKGQVSRLIRLGTPGRSSLSRVQFLAGGKPIAATCSCTPIEMGNGEMALLLASVDAIDPEVLEMAGEPGADAITTSILPPSAHYGLLRGGRLVDGSQGLDDTPRDETPAVRLPADSKGAELLILLPAAATEQPSLQGLSDGPGESEADLANTPEPMLPLGLEPLPPPVPVPPEVAGSEQWVEPMPQNERSLSSLFDRLAEDTGLYAALPLEDESFAEIPPPPPAEDEVVSPPLETDMVAAVIHYADDPEGPTPDADAPPSHWLITGRGFRALGPEPEAEPPVEVTAQPPEATPASIASVDAAPDAEAAERVSRYNFEELGRILTDRVGGEPQASQAPDLAGVPKVSPQGVINLSAETLVLNRLPLAILVFRDQQVLFANRALTDLLGHESVESLRAAGIASIFPSEETANAGPVNRLVRRDGTPLPVTARLQSVSWQGRAALMLSASPAESVRGHEGAVRAFAEIAAEARQEGFIVADRAGVVRQLSGHGATLLGRPQDDIVGRPLAILVGKMDMEPLRTFLEKPARFAETTRPSLVAGSEDGSAELTLFAEGQAGVVTGYFGLIQKATHTAPPVLADEDSEPALLGRLSRGIRRPLNTIVGFADLIRSAALGTLDASRYAEYARDIRTAGLEIAVLVDELDDFARLREGRYAARLSDVDLGVLLEGCLVRVKPQASAARVLVRSAIAERLPGIRADRASLGQALLNLLASAIDQTPIGGSVILSAHPQDDGGIEIHVRDGAQSGTELAERFLVFRDGVDKDGEQLHPVRSSVGLALTRSLLAVNACSLSVDPLIGSGTLFSLLIPAELVAGN